MNNDYIMRPTILTISIPNDNHENMRNKYYMIKSLLVYLESANCRKYMQESDRRQKMKVVTEKFRDVLMYKAFNPF
jgi:hypothetical protein